MSILICSAALAAEGPGVGPAANVEGVGMHAGKLPGYPASHGCLRLPSTVIPLIYDKTMIGTPVTIE